MVRLGKTLYKLPVTFTLRDQQDTCTMFLQSHEALPCPQAFKQQSSIAINYTEFSCVPSETKHQTPLFHLLEADRCKVFLTEALLVLSEQL